MSKLESVFEVFDSSGGKTIYLLGRKSHKGILIERIQQFTCRNMLRIWCSAYCTSPVLALP
jgi:hypothetical protein